MESAKGIFPAPAAQGLSLRSHNRKAARKDLNAFAEMLAEGYEPEAAALMLGRVPAYGRVLLQRIIKRLGPQAQ